MMISTSPVWVKMGNSFCDTSDEPPKLDRVWRCLRTVDAREECDATEDGRRMGNERSALAESG